MDVLLLILDNKKIKKIRHFLRIFPINLRERVFKYTFLLLLVFILKFNLTRIVKISLLYATL